ncbi:MAG: endo alpha-1,4 polygalactosaminidase [Anaerolineales bacterium]
MRKLSFPCLLALLSLLLSAYRPVPANFAATVMLKAGSLTTQTGGTGGQPVANLGVKDQSGSADDWNKYVEFTTLNAPYLGYMTYSVPSGVPLSTITALTVLVNYKGALEATQTWTWAIYDCTGKTWVAIGSNAGAQNWLWTSFAFAVPAPPGRFVNSATRQVRIQLRSNNALDSADLDYQVIRLSYSVPYWKPALNTSWQIQYSGAIDTSLNVQVYNLDGFETPKTTVAALHARGIKVMCYISAGSYEKGRPDAASFPPSVLGNVLDGWPDERWLDIRQISILKPIMEARMEMCKTKGFDGIDPDNVEGYANNSGFPLTYQQQLTYNIFLANAAHSRGLGIGLKNDLGQVSDLVGYFDWQLNEQCFQYNECSLLPFIRAGKPVFNIEYNLTTAQFCAQANAYNFNSLRKRLALDAYRQACR